MLATLSTLHFPTRSIADFGLSLAVDKLISDKKFLIIVAILLYEYEMPEIIEHRSFGARGTDDLVLHLHFSEDNRTDTSWSPLLLEFERIGSRGDGRSVGSKALGLVFCRYCICDYCS